MSRTPTNLLHVAGWYGSTHASALWRKDAAFLEVFREEGIAGFDPQVDDWEPSFAAIEAEVMATASVVIIRLENNELLNGSLGSIAEIGLALTSAALRGQIIAVSIEDGLLTTLNEPGAIAQYMVLEMFLEYVEDTAELAHFVRIHRGDNLDELATMACLVAKQQMKTGQPSLNFEDFLTRKAGRSQNHHPKQVVLGGSGGPYAEAHYEAFARKKQSLIAPYLGTGHAVKVLSEGAIAAAWRIPYGSLDPLQTALAMRTLLSIELEYKRAADVLLLPIMAEAASKAAATEIGWLLLYALTTGQEVRVCLEPFDPVDYIRYHLADVDVTAGTGEKFMRLALQQAGVSDTILATATRPEVFETFELFKALKQGRPPTFRQLKQSLLGQTGACQNADNTRRVRTLVQAHLERLNADARFPDFFTYSNRFEV